MGFVAKKQGEESPEPNIQADMDAPGGRRNDLVGGIAGVEAQGDALKPGNQVQLDEGEPTGTAPPDATESGQTEQLTLIREALLAQMERMEGKGIGDAEFDPACTLDSWKTLKPTGYTTCIDTQRAVSQMAFAASGLAVKRAEGSTEDLFAFGTKTREGATAINAWVEASPNMGTEPKPGDMLMLEKGGRAVDKPGENLAFSRKRFLKKEARYKKQLAQLEESKATAKNLKTIAARMENVQLALDRAAADYETAKQLLAPKLEAAKQKVMEHVAKGGKLEFSHVGFFKSSRDQLGDDGAPTGRRIWETFDGGQSGIAGAVDGQGAMSLTRIYEPTTNFITGEASQGGAPRWLAGWIDVDKMVKQSGPGATEEGVG